MQKDEKNQREQAEDNVEQGKGADNSAARQQNTDETTQSGATSQGDTSSVSNDDLEKKNAELNDKYLRLYSEYDNYRKRTIREKADIIKTAGEDVFKAIIPVIDDFERAIRANENATDADAMKEGMKLIYSKFKAAVMQKGLQPFESVGNQFDPEIMEAITHIPADSKNGSGKVVDEIEKGYRLGDKVIRYAKVVVAQ